MPIAYPKYVGIVGCSILWLFSNRITSQYIALLPFNSFTRKTSKKGKPETTQATTHICTTHNVNNNNNKSKKKEVSMKKKLFLC